MSFPDPHLRQKRIMERRIRELSEPVSRRLLSPTGTADSAAAGFNDSATGEWKMYGLTNLTTTQQGFYPAPGEKS